jgi:UDP-N-acetylglucosamine/UDP-N-acetylgalactosamine diphosphorylase
VTPTKSNGIKLELFIFDIFPFLSTQCTASASDFAVLSVPRSSEFSPLKNAPGAGIDCPETSKFCLVRSSLNEIISCLMD